MPFDVQALRCGLRGIPLSEDFSFRANTTIGIGGKAPFALFPRSETELERTVRFLARENIPYCLLGRGSNVLASDRGFEGAVVCTRAVCTIRFDCGGVYCGCGADLSEVITLARRKGFGGLHFMAGIPSTAGGAVFMNAGAQERYIASVTEYVDAVENGTRKRFSTEQCDFSYKHSRFIERGSVILGAFLRLRAMEKDKIDEALGSVRKARSRLPKGRSMGCVFKNPCGVSAGELIERAGLKGMSCGGAVISEEHANFIINRGGATASDVLFLIGRAKDAVFQRTGIRLSEEIRYIGEF